MARLRISPYKCDDTPVSFIILDIQVVSLIMIIYCTSSIYQDVAQTASYAQITAVTTHCNTIVEAP